jgi:hypothetical protein
MHEESRVGEPLDWAIRTWLGDPSRAITKDKYTRAPPGVPGATSVCNQFSAVFLRITSTYHGNLAPKSPPLTFTGLLGPRLGARECGICVAGASPNCARCCSGCGCACFGEGCASFFSGAFFGGCFVGIGIASGGGTGTALGCGGAGAGDGCSVASTLGVGGATWGSGIAGAELTSVAWIAPGAWLLPHSFPRICPTK